MCSEQAIKNLLQRLPKINKITSVKAEGFEKRQQVAIMPPDSGVDVSDPFGIVKPEHLLSHLFADALPHELGIHPQHGDPCAPLNTKPP